MRGVEGVSRCGRAKTNTRSSAEESGETSRGGHASIAIVSCERR